MLLDHTYQAKSSPPHYDKEEDYKLSHHPIMSPMIPLVDLCTHFRDLPSFVHHPDFDHFAYCWMEFQYQIASSQHPHCRPGVQTWLVSMSAQLLDWIGKYPSSPPPPPPPHHVPVVAIQEDHEASTYHIKSAYQRLIHRFGVLYKLLSMIDHGSIVANQSPQEVVLPVYNTLLKHKLTQPCCSPSSLYDYFSLASSPSPTSSSSGMSTPIVSLSLLSLSSPEPAANTTTTTTTTTSSFRSPSCMQVFPYLNDSSGAPLPHIQPMSLVLPSPPLLSHVVQTPPEAPRYHHPVSWSTPVTPSPLDHPPATQFWSSCPVSPSHPRRRCTSLPDPLPLSTHQTYREEEEDIVEPITPSPSDCRPPPPTPNEEKEDELSSEYRPDNDEEEDEEEDHTAAADEDDDAADEDYKPSVTTNTKKYDFIPSPAPTNDMTTTTSQRAKRRRRALSFKSRSTMSLVPLASNSSTTTITTNATAAKIRRRGRTATSYDQDTTHFLKSMFFNIYSQRDKLTKEQRRQVVERTGLKPRNVTYWFSNHKRRFQSDLDVFRKLIAESNGRIQTYDDYVAWRRDQGLPEMVGDNDM